jgi:hypothetical protein
LVLSPVKRSEKGKLEVKREKGEGEKDVWIPAYCMQGFGQEKSSK